MICRVQAAASARMPRAAKPKSLFKRWHEDASSHIIFAFYMLLGRETCEQQPLPRRCSFPVQKAFLQEMFLFYEAMPRWGAAKTRALFPDASIFFFSFAAFDDEFRDEKKRFSPGQRYYAADVRRMSRGLNAIREGNAQRIRASSPIKSNCSTTERSTAPTRTVRSKQPTRRVRFLFAFLRLRFLCCYTVRRRKSARY